MKRLYILLAGIVIIIVGSIVFFLQPPVDDAIVLDAEPDHAQVDLYSDPFPMALGPADLMVSVTDGGGEPIADANVYTVTYHSHYGGVPITDTVSRYENGYYYIPIIWSTMGQKSVTVYADIPDRETISEEYTIFVYGSQLFDVENQAYRSESELAEELANVPDDEYWIVVPQGAQEITGMYFEDFVPNLISLSVSGKHTLVIRNDDFVDNTIGPFYVGAGEILRQRFYEPGVFQGVCSVNQGLVRIEVDE